jgi:tripartite-type tricarboxylate transporter receptor subunit TctC
VVGTARLARAKPDGYTIGFASQPTLVFNQAIYRKPGYDSVKDFAPIALLGYAMNVMVVHPSNPASTPADIVAAARSSPRKLTYASAGAGTSHHLAGALFARMTGSELVHIPYRGAAQGVLAVMSNEVTMGLFTIPSVIDLIRAGKLKALAVTGAERSPLLAETPTLDEQGMAGYQLVTWAGLIAPRATPSSIIDGLNAAVIAIVSSPAAKDKLASQGVEPAVPLTPAEFARLISDDLVRWVPVVRASGAKAY